MTIALYVALAVVTWCTYKFWNGLKFVNFLPGKRPLFSPLSPFGALMPNNAINPGPTWYWAQRKTAYFNKTHDIISFVPLLGSPSYYTNSLDVMKQILGSEMKLNIEKPYDLTLARLFGDSLPSVNGEAWRRHRRVVAPAFSQKLYDSVGREVQAVYKEMMKAEGWDTRQTVEIPDCIPFMLNFTLCVIAKLGFGLDNPWPVESAEDLHDFPHALRVVSKTLIPRIIIPNWAYGLPIEGLRKMKTSWDTVSSFMLSAIQTRKMATNGEVDVDDESIPGDILNRLVSSWAGVGKYGLSETEVIGNMYSLMFAGHETTSSGLVSTLACLAINQDAQDKVFQEISDASLDTNSLQYTLFCIWEGQRLFPSANFLPRQVTQDMQLQVVRPTPQTILVKKDSWIMIDFPSTFRNPHFFPDPDRFVPERWAGVSEHDVGTFGFGPRACVGRKFAQTESLAIVAALLKDWRVDLVLQPGESRGAVAERILNNAGQTGTAFGLKHVPLRLVRRSQL